MSYEMFCSALERLLWKLGRAVFGGKKRDILFAELGICDLCMDNLAYAERYDEENKEG